MSDSSPSRSNDERDERGRFAPGNTTGRRGGNPGARRLHELQQAVRDACTPDDVATVMRNLHASALAGDTHAAAVYLARCVGSRTFVELDLPEIRAAADLGEAARSVLAAVAEGRCDVESGERLLGLVRGVGEAAVVEQLEARIGALEAGR